MKERLIAKLLVLQMKLKSINNYSHENGNALFKYSIEFETLLSVLCKLNDQEYNTIANNYALETQRYCELGCALCDEKNRQNAFTKGQNELNLNVSKSIKLLTQQLIENQNNHN